MLGAGLVAAGFGFLVGIPALRLTGPYLTIATLGFGIAVNQVLTNWAALSGGRGGLFLPKLAIAGTRTMLPGYRRNRPFGFQFCSPHTSRTISRNTSKRASASPGITSNG